LARGLHSCWHQPTGGQHDQQRNHPPHRFRRCRHRDQIAELRTNDSVAAELAALKAKLGKAD
jgi:hypothetical protein